jgi:Domain of unknown function (DUF4347)
MIRTTTDIAVSNRPAAEQGSRECETKAPRLTGGKAMTPTTEVPVTEVLFVDPGVPDLATVFSGLRPGVEAILLTPDRSPAAQMADALAGRRDLAAVHVIAHGAPGVVAFTAGAWSLDTLCRDAAQLAAIGHALSADGEVRLWCCDTAQGDAGETFLEALSNTVGVDVCGAAGRVGAATLGGAWDLSARASRPKPQPPLTPVGVEAYAGVLASPVTVIGEFLFEGFENGNPNDTINVTVSLAPGTYTL